MAAGIVGFALLPFALIDLLVLVLGCLSSWEPFFDWRGLLFALLFMVPALVIWGMLMEVWRGRRSMRFIRLTWGLHVLFNIATSIGVMAFSIVDPGSFPLNLSPLIVMLLVLATSAFFLRKTFNHETPTY